MASIPIDNRSPDTVPTMPNGFMTPNEAPRAKPDDVGDKVKSEPDLITIAKRLHEQAKLARKDREAKWQTCKDFYDGKQWPVKRASNRASPNVNVIRAVVQTVLPIMTDTSPSFGVMARDFNDYKFAEFLTDLLSVWWKRRSMNHVLVESLMDAVVTDVGIVKVVYNEELDDSIGDVEVVVCDPRRIYVPKNAIDFDRNCPWVIHEFFMSRGRLAVKFPKARDVIKHAQAASDIPNSTDVDVSIKVVSPIDKAITGPDNKSAAASMMTANEEVRVWELWIDDDTVLEEERMNQETGETETVVKMKYPHGRMVTMLPDCDEILQDVENPYRDGEKPFVRFIDTLEPRAFYGVGEVEPLMEAQKMINKVFATIIDWSNMMANPCWVIDSNSGVDPDMITSQVGQIIVKQPGTGVQRVDAPPVPPQLFDLYHTLMQLLDQQSGVHEVTQGRKPAGITAAAAIETLQEAAQTRIRLKERNLLTSLYRLGTLIVSRMLQYYTEPRVVELTGRDDLAGNWPEYVRFYVEQNEDGEGGTLYSPVLQKITYDEANGAYVEGDAETQPPTLGQFELDITTGTSLPFIKQQRSEQALQLFGAKAIDQQALLDVLEFPDKDGIMQRMKNAEQQAAEAQAGAAPPGAPPEMQVA